MAMMKINAVLQPSMGRKGIHDYKLSLRVLKIARDLPKHLALLRLFGKKRTFENWD